MAQNTPLPAAAPLHDAAGVGDAVAVADLLKDGADRNARVDREGYSYSDGATALHIAAREDHLSVAVALLAAGAWPDGRASDEDCNDPTPLHEASARGGVEVTKALLKAGAGKDIFASFGTGGPCLTALDLAVENGHLEVVRTLAEAGADVNLIYEDGYAEVPPLVTAAKQGNVDAALVLLDAGADVNGFGQDGFSALHQAKDVRVMEVLLNAGADIEQGITTDYDSHGCDEATPIGWLSLKTHQRFSPLQNLGYGLEVGAALSSEDEIGRATAMVQLLLRRGAKIDSKAGCVGHCLRTGARGPPLSAAVYNGTTAICAALIDNGADLDATDWELQDFDADGDVKIRPIHDAARFGDVDILRLLLGAGAGANSLSNFRRGDDLERWGTPLHVACRYSQLGCVRELLRWGADVWAEERQSSGEEEEEEEEEKAPCECESCLSKSAGCGKTPAEVIGLRDVVTNLEINARPSDSTTVGDGDEIRRELLWWRRCAVVLLAARLAKQVSADGGTTTGG
ncbi:similar to ankyrin 2,3/unc44 [Ectocarpus siliculosus]|uniref:Similar to ankyrin 2,3/unc44, partial n=1 Tax=Ectocarpus siliculosus TaxID=2880 RepID=D8LQT5_ECTSI|nr:similar to ankyrin 2,3/unc44 [Ectocarpus siliculosus]|eukprot:CBN74962.1 similar to ankyrin 2,3/unc44 [Ectocarpus siliculosus]